MNVQSLKPGEFEGRYGSQHWIGDSTVAILVGDSQDALKRYLAGSGFVNPYTTFSWGRNPADEFVRDGTNYTDLALDGIGELTGDPLDAKSTIKGISEENGLRDAISGYVPGQLKQLGATLPLKGREHARIYRLNDGRYAAEIHKDPGISEYVDGNRLWNGDLSTIFEGAVKAVKYHFIDPKIREYKSKLTDGISSLFKSGRGSETANIVKFPGLEWEEPVAQAA